MAAIKKFFQKKKMDAKFKMAGEGHKLTEDTRSVPSTSLRPQSVQRSRAGPSQEAARAAEAALLRTTKAQNKPGTVYIVKTFEIEMKVMNSMYTCITYACITYHYMNTCIHFFCISSFVP